MSRAMTVWNPSILILLAGTLVAGPSLCAGGVITHPCNSACVPGDSRHNPDEDGHGCGHEKNCAGDPCSLIMTRSDQRQVDTARLASAAHAAVLLPGGAAPADLMPALPWSCDSQLQTGPRLAFPAQDTPLLI
jgi:hypothetical protein